MNEEVEINGESLHDLVEEDGEYAPEMEAFLAALVSQYNIHSVTVDSDHRYLLVERSTHDIGAFVTSWESLGDAITYHDTQEYAEEWAIHGIYDLQRGKQFTAMSTSSIVEVENYTLEDL